MCKLWKHQRKYKGSYKRSREVNLAIPLSLLAIGVDLAFTDAFSPDRQKGKSGSRIVIS